MIILGIADTHEAHACILRDGEIVAIMAEERLSRLKADMCYPKKSIDSVIRIAGIEPSDIDIVAFAGAQLGLYMFQCLYKMNALFSVRDWIKQCEKYWGPRLIENKKLTPFDDFELFKHLRGEQLAQDEYYPFLEKAKISSEKNYSTIANKLRKDVVNEHLGVDKNKVHFFRHEDCHKHYGYYSSPFKKGEKTLVFSIEGGGDDSSATVSIMDDENLKEVWRSNKVQAGRLYRYVTLILGMKPMQHEYKLMGLAPYGTEYHGRRSLDFFRKINIVKGLEIKDTGFIPDLYFSVKDALEGERFDGIAWGIQVWLEELLCEWVKNNVEEYGIDNVVLTGGVAQNIKACKKLVELDCINKFWVGPISGDGSLGVGAAWHAYRKFDDQKNINGLPNVYLGSSYNNNDVSKAIHKNKDIKQFKVIENFTASSVAKWIESGLVVARFNGRMEFGQRALGNRSILADPRLSESVEKINKKIKYRDFWMPFTPSMMKEEADRLLINPKNVYSPFMTMAFDLKPQYHSILPAVIHPSDKTIRPQMLIEDDNPGYYQILKEFKKLSGYGVLLNTSFNLHGDAIVESPEDAIRTFLKSELDILTFDTVAISRVDL